MVRINEDFWDDKESKEDISDGKDERRIDDIQQTDVEYAVTFSMRYWLNAAKFNDARDFQTFTTKYAPRINRMINKLFDYFNAIKNHSDVEFWSGSDIYDTEAEYNGFVFHYKSSEPLNNAMYATVSVNCKFRDSKQVMRFVKSAINCLSFDTTDIRDDISFNGISFQTDDEIHIESKKVFISSVWVKNKYSENLFRFARTLLPDEDHLYEHLRTLSGTMNYDITEFINKTFYKTKCIIGGLSKPISEVSGKFVDTFDNIETVNYDAFSEPEKNYDMDYNRLWNFSEKKDLVQRFLYEKKPDCHIRLIKCLDDSGEKYLRMLYCFDKTEYIEDSKYGEPECDLMIHTNLGMYGAFSTANVDCKILAGFLTPLHYLGVDINKILPKMEKWFKYELTAETKGKLTRYIQKNISGMRA